MVRRGPVGALYPFWALGPKRPSSMAVVRVGELHPGYRGVAGGWSSAASRVPSTAGTGRGWCRPCHTSSRSRTQQPTLGVEGSFGNRAPDGRSENSPDSGARSRVRGCHKDNGHPRRPPNIWAALRPAGPQLVVACVGGGTERKCRELVGGVGFRRVDRFYIRHRNFERPLRGSI